MAFRARSDADAVRMLIDQAVFPETMSEMIDAIAAIQPSALDILETRAAADDPGRKMRISADIAKNIEAHNALIDKITNGHGEPMRLPKAAPGARLKVKPSPKGK